MATKPTRSFAQKTWPAGQAQITSQAQNQLAEVAEATSAMYSATEPIQQINQQLTQRAVLRQHQIADRLPEASNPPWVCTLLSKRAASNLLKNTAALVEPRGNDLLAGLTADTGPVQPWQHLRPYL